MELCVTHFFFSHNDRRIVAPRIHYTHGLFVIAALEEETFGRVDAHFVACEREGNCAATCGAVLEIGTFATFCIDLGKVAHGGADFGKILTHLQEGAESRLFDIAEDIAACLVIA